MKLNQIIMGEVTKNESKNKKRTSSKGIESWKK